LATVNDLAGQKDQFLRKFLRFSCREILRNFLRILFETGIASPLETLSVGSSLLGKLTRNIGSKFHSKLPKSFHSNLLESVVTRCLLQTFVSNLRETISNHLLESCSINILEMYAKKISKTTITMDNIECEEDPATV